MITEVIETPRGQMLNLHHDHNSPRRRAGDLGHDREISQVRDWLSQIASPVFLDVGAHNGLFCVNVQDLCSRIYAWEPQRIVFNLLAGTIALNSWTHVWAYWGALGASSGEIPIPSYNYSQGANFGGIELGCPSSGGDGVGQSRAEWNGETAPLRTLDSYNFQQADVIKIDVEGMEMDALRGGVETILRLRPRLLIEHSKVGIGLLQDWLRDYGYRCADLGGDLACEVAR